MLQVSVRDSRGTDRQWIQSVYHEYLTDLASSSATGVFPMLGEIGQREADQLVQLFSDLNASVLTVCYAEARVGFAKINTVVERAALAAPAPASGRMQPGTDRGVTSAAQFSLAEFFIARPWRRRGIGTQAVRLILDRFTGRWVITEYLRNETAVRFWRRVVMAYTAGKYQERIVNGEVQQRFESGGRRTVLR